MRKSRYQRGSVKKQNGRWVGMWWQDGRRKSRVLGLVKDMTKSDARRMVEQIAAESNAKREEGREWRFDEFVKEVYFPFYSRKWKMSTIVTNRNRVNLHFVYEFRSRALKSVSREELQTLLDQKAAAGLSFSVVDHLRWDIKQIFDMALAEGYVERNPAAMIWTPRESVRPVRQIMTIEEVKQCFSVLALRERLIFKLAVLAGMRPGEIFALTWGRLTGSYADIRQRVYRGIIDTPKTNQSVRKAALSEGLLAEIEAWKKLAVSTADNAWVFPSERLTPVARENIWRRHIHHKLKKVGLEWVNFQVLRRTHATLMGSMGVDGKLVADQLGHSLDVNQNVYRQSPVEVRRAAVNDLERSIQGM